ncbi:MAG TPA: WecB/TagA/CpsF family glycosyltransferase [Gemmatimonadaceae bacterium]|nr:WecB/TagA/CpsF family glycosyltransferase [Gemmatimonadaceae bacterium]
MPQMIDLGRHTVLGVRIAAVDYEAATEAVLAAAAKRQPMSLTCAAVHAIALSAKDRACRHRLNSFDLIVPDGQPVRWALRWLHRVQLNDRVRGTDLLPHICRGAAERGIPIYLYGSMPETVALLRKRLGEQFPKLRIAGSRPSLFRSATEQERLQIAQEIRSSGARIVFVGLGCPRQEIWIYENRDLLDMPLVGIGSAFDTNAGVIEQAPLWMQERGVEWLWRLRCEPRRLWRRYLFLNPLYLALLAAEKLRLTNFDDRIAAPPQPVRVA